MLGSIIGDIVGSVYEFNNIKTKDFLLFGPKNNFTDDSIMTVAVTDWLLRDSTFSHKALEESMIWFAYEYPCPMGGYGGMFADWIENPQGRVSETIGSNGKSQPVIFCDRKPYNSCGNGSAMRVSSVGWMFDTLQRTLEIAERSASITHNHPEGIKGAQATAQCIFMARHGASKRSIAQAVEARFGYDLSMTVAQLQRRYSWEGIDGKGNGGLCQESVPQAIICALEADDYEDALRNAVSIGGDSDTIGCITGAIAEALFGIPVEIYEAGFSYLPDEFAEIVRQFESKYGSGLLKEGEEVKPCSQPIFTPDHFAKFKDVQSRPECIESLRSWAIDYSERRRSGENVSLHGIHQLRHWDHVYENGMALIDEGVDFLVVAAFAYVHDLWRNNDNSDPNHGPRAAEHLPAFRDDVFSWMTDEQFALLLEACRVHTLGVATHNATIDACMDADKLDLPRVGIQPDPRKMCTPKGVVLAESLKQ